jgi:hypothetical protein
MKLTRNEIFLLAAVLAALVLGAWARHHRERQRVSAILVQPPPSAKAQK